MKVILFYYFAILSNSSSSLNNKVVKFDGLISVNLLSNKSFLTRSYTVLSPSPPFSTSPILLLLLSHLLPLYPVPFPTHSSVPPLDFFLRPYTIEGLPSAMQ